MPGGNLTNGTLWCWGLNRDGQLGTGDTQTVTKPTKVGSDSDWVGLAPAYQHTCAVRGSDRELYCWGTNKFGQLGVGDVRRRLTPTHVIGDGWKGPSGGFSHTCSTRIDFTLWCWGGNTSGQLGLGDNQERLTPTQV